ncbi:polymorphic toxin type 15 domain-containing protein [Agromyces sp. NPDC049794]|uniref:polymorphic toxin type 15 domain-containing protein n=1 Tax=unclassified Agromyces TaxID=2639701 RepID=UPI0033F7CF65
MAHVKLDPARLVQDGDDLFSIARTLDSAVTTLVDRLGNSGGMAGDDNAAEEFCQGSDGYDALAGPTISAVTSFGNALRIVDAALSNTARAYDGAQKPGAGLDPATASPAEATATIDEGKASVPSALGAGWPGPLGEFQELIEWGLAQIGVVIPTGDEDKLQAASDAWGSFGDSIQSAKSRVSSSMPNVAAMTLPQQGRMLSCRTSLSEGLDRMRESADAMQQWIADFRSQLRQMREELGWFLKQMAIEIAAELAIGGLLTVVTAGLGALATAAKVGTTVIRWCMKIAKLIDRLKDFLKGIRGLKGALVRGGLRAGKEGLQAGLASAIASASVNKMREGEEGYERQDVGTAFLSAFAGGAASSPASRFLGGSGGPGLRAGTREVAGGTGAGAIDGLVSSGVESGLSGNEFNPISGMVLGALLGGGLTAGARGINAVRPGGNGTATVDPSGAGVTTPDGPTPAGADGGTSNPGGVAPVDVSNDGPTPGAGDTGTSTIDGGNAVDVPSGSPDASAPAGPDGSSPSAPEASASSAPEASTPDASAPAGSDGSSPSAPEASAPASSTPDASAPAGSDGSSSSPPDVSAPAAPEASAPAAPEASAPAAPEASAPASPEASSPAAETAPDFAPVEASATSQHDAPVAAASGSAASATQSAHSTPAAAAEGDAPAADAAAADAPAADAPEADPAEAGAATPDASDASDADDAGELAPEEAAAAAGGAAAVAGAAALLTKPTLPGAQTPTGSTPEASTSPQAATPDGTAPGSGTPGAKPDGTSQSGTDNGTTDGGKPDTPENNHTDRTIDQIDHALGEINPNYDPSDPQNGYATNCGNTSSILNDFLNGQPSAEAPTGTLDVPEMEARTGNPQTPMTPAQIDASLRAMGPGSHCVVGIDRSTGDGHWFNAYFDGTTVWSLDAQTGTRSPWPPNEPHATNWDASIRPEHVVDSDGSTSGVTNAPPSAAQSGVAPTAATHEASAPDGDRFANTRFEGQATVSPDHASDGSKGAGTTYNGYAIPERTPEIRNQLDELAARPDSPIVRNEDGSYSLKDPIEVDAFDMSNPEHDWDEFQRQVGLQQQGLNQLTIAEWRHNVDFYEQQNRVAKSEQAAGNHALADAGVQMKGQAVLHGPDQVAGGRADRYDGAGSLRVNSSLGSQWQHRIDDLRQDVAGAMASVDPKLRPHVKLNVHLGATNSVDGSPAATQAKLASAQPVTSGTPAPAPRAGALEPSATGTSGDPASDAPDVGVPVDASDGAAPSVEPEGSEPSADTDPSEPSESSSPESESTREELAAADPVPATVHHPILDADFPHLQVEETRVASVETVNVQGARTDRLRFLFNCHHVVNALELRFRGYDVIAAPTIQGLFTDPETGATRLHGEGRIPTQIAADWVQTDGSRRDFEDLGVEVDGSAMTALATLTESWPIGGRGFIGGFWKTGGGHVYTVVKEADGIRFYDGQVAKTDVSSYLDNMLYNDAKQPWATIKVLRVDDLVPTSEVLKTSRPHTAAELQLLKDWEASSRMPKEIFDREVAANARWRERNDELIAEMDETLADPTASPADRKRAWGERRYLQMQNRELIEGLHKLVESFESTAPPPGPILGQPSTTPPPGPILGEASATPLRPPTPPEDRDEGEPESLTPPGALTGLSAAIDVTAAAANASGIGGTSE